MAATTRIQVAIAAVIEELDRQQVGLTLRERDTLLDVLCSRLAHEVRALHDERQEQAID